MPRTIPGILAVLVLASGSAMNAEIDSTAVVITKLANTRETYHSAFMAAFSPFLAQLEKSGNVTPVQLAKIKKEADRFANQVYDDPDFVEGISTAYSKEFSEAELKQLLAFYETSLGKKLLDRQPVTGRSRQPGAAPDVFGFFVNARYKPPRRI